MSDQTPETTATTTASSVESVVMQDGRTVQFHGNRKVVKTTELADGQAVVRFDCRNGEVRNFNVMDADMVRLACHGAESKIGDEYAGIQDIEDIVVSIDEMIARLYRKEWNVKRASNPAAGASDLVKALAEVLGKDVAVIKDFLSRKSNEEKAAFRKSDRVAPVLARIAAEKASKKPTSVDVGSLFSEIEGI